MWTVTVVDDEIATHAAIDADSPTGRLKLSAARFEVVAVACASGGLPSTWQLSVTDVSINRRPGISAQG